MSPRSRSPLSGAAGSLWTFARLCRLENPAEASRSTPRRAPRTALQLATFAALAWGCSVAPESYEADAHKGSTHAVVAISRQDALRTAPRGDALAGFVHLPASADRDRALELAGLGIELPEPGQCWQRPPERTSEGLAGVPHIEFLDAGRVRLIAGGAPHELAPHAFPTIADFISGVVYASRNRNGEGLPAAQLYRIETSNDGTVAELSASHDAPPMPTDVTLGGAPFESVEELAGGQPLDVTWSGSNEPTDRLYVELSAGSKSQVCTFEDASGAGTVPTDGFAAGGDAQLALHRVRVARTVPHSPARDDKNGAAASVVDQLEVRFDFSVSRGIRFE